MAEVRLQEGESLENALRRFKRKVQQEDIIKEVKRHSFYLKPGEKKWFWWTYDFANEDKSPPFHVRFDSDLKPGEVFEIGYHLKKNAAPAPDWKYAHKYIFKYDGDRKYIDLYELK